MLDHILIAIIAAAAIGGMYDYGRRKLLLEHGRMLSADRTSHLERNVEVARARSEQFNDELRMLQKSYADLTLKFGAIEVQSKNAFDVALDLKERVTERVEAVERDCNGMSVSVQDLRSLWSKIEPTLICMQDDIVKRDAAITNVAEEVVKLNQQQAIALAGIAKMPKTGFGRPTNNG